MSTQTLSLTAATRADLTQAEQALHQVATTLGWAAIQLKPYSWRLAAMADHYAERIGELRADTIKLRDGEGD